MTNGDKYAYYASIGAVVTIALIVFTMIFGFNFGAAAGIPLGVITVLTGLASSILAIKAGFQHEVERAEARKSGRY